MTAALDVPVSLTPAAIEEVKRLMNVPEADQPSYLRIGVKGGGCSGMTYVLGFDNEEEGDVRYEVEGVPLLIKNAHAIYLYGMEVNYESGLNARGFTFKNPNASSTCGCGTSFAV
jgi:iron-sulfur cluster assembly protein